MIYLSWSIPYTLVVLAVLAFTWVVARKAVEAVNEHKTEIVKDKAVALQKKCVNITGVLVFLVLTFFAVDVGDTSAKHHRVNYDAAVDTRSMDKVESKRPNPIDIQEAFNKALGK